MNGNGFVKIHRELFKHPIWLKSTPEQKVILIALIGMVNHEPNKWEWKGEQFEVKRGQTITSLDSICAECGKGITIQNVRTALARFEKFGFLTNESTKTGRLITICNYCKWQDKADEPNKDANKDLTKTSQRPNKDLTSNKKDKNDKKDKNNKAIYSRETEEIIDYLNEVCGTRYRATGRKTRDLIQARMNEGFTVEDFKIVIFKKARQWQNDPKMCKFLRPETLFSNKFEGYLNEKEALSFAERLAMA